MVVIPPEREPRPDDDPRAQRIERIVARVVRERSSGVAVDEAALLTEHADLMPELGRRLRLLRALDDALLDPAPTDSAEGLDPESAAASFDADARFIESQLPRYEILEMIEHGGQGIVYKAWDKSIRRHVAIKVLLHGPFASREQRQRLQREARLIARIQHPHIVTSYESGDIGGRQYFAMEYVEGLPIDDHAMLNDLAPREIVQLFIQVCRAVNTAHQAGVIHRDLKPSNILVNLAGEPKILDFGLAKDLGVEELGAATQTCSEIGHVVGTLPYLSPEQAEDSTAIDVRSDIYTLGVLLFRLLTHEFPYAVDGPQDDVRRNIRFREARRLSAAGVSGAGRRERFDRDLEAIVAQALAKEKERRYQSVDGLAADLERYLAGEVISARGHQTGYVLRKTLARHRMAVGVGTAFLLVIVVSLVVTTALWRRAEYLVETYQAGLEMGSYFKLATVERDDGRIEQAIAMFEKVIEIGERGGSQDPVVLRSIFDAHERLADLYLRRDEVAKAQPHVEAALQLANRSDWPGADPMQLMRIRYRAKQAEAMNWLKLEDYPAAVAAHQDVIAMVAALREQDPGDAYLLDSLVIAYQGLGGAQRRLGNLDAALGAYERGRELAAELVDQNPESLDYIVTLAISELQIGVWHLSLRTEEGDQAATPWLQRCASTLDSLPAARAAQSDVLRCRDALAKNHSLIERRKAARRAEEVEEVPVQSADNSASGTAPH